MPEEVPASPHGEPVSPDVDHGPTIPAIPENDWLTAMCQSLGDIPAVNDTSPQLIVDMSNTCPIDVQLQNTDVAGSVIEPQPSTGIPSRSVDEVTSRTPSKTLRTWILDDSLQVSLQQTGHKLHILTNECSVVGMNCHVSKNGIMMNILTYVDFKDKIHRVNTKYATSSVICNNQLAMFSRGDNVVLQQIFHANEFKLKLNPLKINCFTLNKIREIIFDIDKAIEEALVNNVLPEKILEKSVPSPPPHPNLMNEFLIVLQDEVETNVNKLFQCAACEIEDPSQFNHDCMMQTYDFKYMSYSTNAFLMLNVKNVVNKLQSKNILKCFSSDFFKHMTYDSIEPNLMKVIDY